MFKWIFFVQILIRCSRPVNLNCRWLFVWQKPIGILGAYALGLFVLPLWNSFCWFVTSMVKIRKIKFYGKYVLYETFWCTWLDQMLTSLNTCYCFWLLFGVKHMTAVILVAVFWISWDWAALLHSWDYFFPYPCHI